MSLQQTKGALMMKRLKIAAVWCLGSYLFFTMGAPVLSSKMLEATVTGVTALVTSEEVKPSPVTGNPEAKSIVVLTIDDALDEEPGDNLDDPDRPRSVLPVYRAFQDARLPATQFVPPATLDKDSQLTTAELIYWHKWGITAECHGLTHKRFSDLTQEQLFRELTVCQALLQDKTGYLSQIVASPGGDCGQKSGSEKCDPAILKTIHEAGFVAHVKAWGWAPRPKQRNTREKTDLDGILRLEVDNFSGVVDVCAAVNDAVKHSQMLVLEFHFATDRPKASSPRKLADIPPPYTVYTDVLKEMVDCVARARDAGHVQVLPIHEALKAMGLVMEVPDRQSQLGHPGMGPGA